MNDGDVNVSGVYCIHHKPSGRRYIGSSKCIAKRWKTHRTDLKREEHANRIISAAVHEDGIESLEFYVLEETDNLFDREQFWIDFFKEVWGVMNISLIVNEIPRCAKWRSKRESRPPRTAYGRRMVVLKNREKERAEENLKKESEKKELIAMRKIQRIIEENKKHENNFSVRARGANWRGNELLARKG